MAQPEYHPHAAKRKPCFRCGTPSLRLYRVRHDAGRQWDFVCDACWPAVAKDNPFYVYGGTWKGTRHKNTSPKNTSSDADPDTPDA